MASKRIKKKRRILDLEQQEFLEEVKTKINNGECIKGEKDLHECIYKLFCNICSSRKIVWLLEKNSNEVIFNCKMCGNKGTLPKEKYDMAIKNHKGQVFV